MSTRRPRDADRETGHPWWTLLAGAIGFGTGLALARFLAPRRHTIDPRLFLSGLGPLEIPPTVIVPGILGSGLVRPDGTPVWLNVRNAVGYYNLSLPFTIPLARSRDELLPRGLLGTDAWMPRLFGFTEYYDLMALLKGAGFKPAESPGATAPLYHIFSYDWRRDLSESACRLHETLEALAEARGDPDARFDVVGHSMGGLVARYYLRYGGVELDEARQVTWAGARRIRNLILVAVPNAGGIHALEALLYGSRVGLSYTTLAPSVVAGMPSVYQLLPPPGVSALLDPGGEPMDVDLFDAGVWERFGWGPFAPGLRRTEMEEREHSTYVDFVTAALARGRALHEALARPAPAPCPTRVVLLAGDGLPTLARAIMTDDHGPPVRFEAATRAEADRMFEAGDGRVTCASALASHLPRAEEDESACGIPEVTQSFFGATDHHGIYAEPTFQSILLRLLLRPSRRSLPRAAVAGQLAR
jgi:pimeloyl-ACP methyl ester carboxylesterase